MVGYREAPHLTNKQTPSYYLSRGVRYSLNNLGASEVDGHQDCVDLRGRRHEGSSNENGR